MLERLLTQNGGEFHGRGDLGQFFRRAFGGDGDDDGLDFPEGVGQGDVIDTIGKTEADAGARRKVEGFEFCRERIYAFREGGVGDFNGFLDERRFLRLAADGMVEEFVQVHGRSARDGGGNLTAKYAKYTKELGGERARMEGGGLKMAGMADSVPLERAMGGRIV